MAPKFSVITVNLNNALGLQKTLESVVCQTYNSFELILIDGGSTDGSLNVIANFKSHITFWVSEPDNGIYHAMNKGINQAKGEYCFFLNSGDLFASKDVLKNIFDEKITSDIVSGNLVVSFDNKTIGHIKGQQNLTFLDIYSSSIKHQATFIKRSLLDKLGCFDESLTISSDWDFFMKVFASGQYSYKYVDVDVSIFDNDGFSNNNPDICRDEYAIIINRYVPKLMQDDYRLLKKFKSIRILDKHTIGWMLFRVITKLTKLIKSG